MSLVQFSQTHRHHTPSTTMPLHRLFSRRSSNRQSRTNSNLSASTASTSSPVSAGLSRPSPLFSGHPKGNMTVAPYVNSLQSASNTNNTSNGNGNAASFDPLNPFASAPPSQATRRPAAAEAPPSYTAAPPAYVAPISESTDDPYAFLASFDTIFIIDDSGSMAGRSWRETGAALAAIAPICTSRDKDGIDLHFLNHRNSFTNLTSAAEVQRVFESVRPSGGTPTGMRLQKLLTRYISALEAHKSGPRSAFDEEGPKPLNIIVITDGVPSDDPESAIVAAAKKLEALNAAPWQVGVQFFQVGNEPGAAEALIELDDGLAEMGCPRDIVDTVPWKGEAGGLSAQAILKVVLGSVNKKLDRRRNSTEEQQRGRAGR